MVNVIITPNPAVLKNRGFLIDVHKLEADSTGKLVRAIQDEETWEPVIERKWFKFTNLDLATMEEDAPTGWGSLDDWSESIESRPFLNIAKTFAIVWGEFIVKDGKNVPNIEFGSLLIPDDAMADYAVVMIAALQLAQGVDPEACGEIVREGMKDAAAKKLEMSQMLLKSIREMASGEGDAATPTSLPGDSPSQPSQPDGPESTGTGTSSGD